MATIKQNASEKIASSLLDALQKDPMETPAEKNAQTELMRTLNQAQTNKSNPKYVEQFMNSLMKMIAILPTDDKHKQHQGLNKQLFKALDSTIRNQEKQGVDQNTIEQEKTLVQALQILKSKGQVIKPVFLKSMNAMIESSLNQVKPGKDGKRNAQILLGIAATTATGTLVGALAGGGIASPGTALAGAAIGAAPAVAGLGVNVGINVFSDTAKAAQQSLAEERAKNNAEKASSVNVDTAPKPMRTPGATPKNTRS